MNAVTNEPDAPDGIAPLARPLALILAADEGIVGRSIRNGRGEMVRDALVNTRLAADLVQRERERRELELAAAPLADDLTLLAVEHPPPPPRGPAPTDRDGASPTRGGAERLASLRFPAHADRLKHVRATVERIASDAGCGPACTEDIVRAVDEACQNVIRHGYGGDPTGEIVLEIDRQADRLVIYLRDFAPRVDVAEIRPRNLDELRPGGLGVHLIRETMDESGFIPCPSGNVFRMAKRIQ